MRDPEELAIGTIEGAINIPLVQNSAHASKEIPRSKKIVVYCQVGQRGYFAARILSADLDLMSKFEWWIQDLFPCDRATGEF